ncbi:hypothetical protein CMV_013921 [Castanea mollissima]|uniref:Uncharacterized protein n=1 Tax=Castanea mollissima TaxID=60419 RepID=A0A8J4RC76_9ROSI|nr:hypothetical protein CMV_013921 [Castanea mollissima]
MHSATLTASPKLSTAFFSSYLFIVSPTSLLAMFLLPVALVVGKGEFPIIPSAMIRDFTGHPPDTPTGRATFSL